MPSWKVWLLFGALLLAFTVFFIVPFTRFLPDPEIDEYSDCVEGPRLSVETSIDWSVARTPRSLEECIWMVSTEFANVVATNIWLGNNGFTIGQPSKVSKKTMMAAFSIKSPGTRLCASVATSRIQLPLSVSQRMLVNNM